MLTDQTTITWLIARTKAEYYGLGMASLSNWTVTAKDPAREPAITSRTV